MRAFELAEAQTQYNLQAKYQEWNRKLFNGELPSVPLQWSRLKNVSGKLEYQIMRPRNRAGGETTLVPDTMKIKINNQYIRTEEELDAILVHEMIHVYMVMQGYYEEQHGPRFMKVLNKLNAQTPFEIPIEDKVGLLQLASANPKDVLVVLLEKWNGQYSFGLLNPSQEQHKVEEVRNKFQYFIDNKQLKQVSVVKVNSVLWSRIASHYPVNRGVKSMKLWVMDEQQDEDLISDLKVNGRLLLQLN